MCEKWFHLIVWNSTLSPWLAGIKYFRGILTNVFFSLFSKKKMVSTWKSLMENICSHLKTETVQTENVFRFYLVGYSKSRSVEALLSNLVVSGHIVHCKNTVNLPADIYTFGHRCVTTMQWINRYTLQDCLQYVHSQQKSMFFPCSF